MTILRHLNLVFEILLAVALSALTIVLLDETVKRYRHLFHPGPAVATDIAHLDTALASRQVVQIAGRLECAPAMVTLSVLHDHEGHPLTEGQPEAWWYPFHDASFPAAIYVSTGLPREKMTLCDRDTVVRGVWRETSQQQRQWLIAAQQKAGFRPAGMEVVPWPVPADRVLPGISGYLDLVEDGALPLLLNWGGFLGWLAGSLVPVVIAWARLRHFLSTRHRQAEHAMPPTTAADPAAYRRGLADLALILTPLAAALYDFHRDREAIDPALPPLLLMPIAVALAGYSAFRYSRERRPWLLLVAAFWALLVVDMTARVSWPAYCLAPLPAAIFGVAVFAGRR